MKTTRIPRLSALTVACLSLVLCLCLMTLAACSTPDGQPRADSEPVAPSRILDSALSMGRTVPAATARKAAEERRLH
jgi:hypothetical protein